MGVPPIPLLPTGGVGGVDPDRAGSGLGGPKQPVTPRTGAALPDRMSGPGPTGELGGLGGPTARAGGQGFGGMPMGGGSLAGQQQRNRRNDIYLPSDDPYAVDVDDDVVPPVLGLEEPQ
jgi:hypothetical protein